MSKVRRRVCERILKGSAAGAVTCRVSLQHQRTGILGCREGTCRKATAAACLHREQLPRGNLPSSCVSLNPKTGQLWTQRPCVWLQLGELRRSISSQKGGVARITPLSISAPPPCFLTNFFCVLPARHLSTPRGGRDPAAEGLTLS